MINIFDALKLNKVLKHMYQTFDFGFYKQENQDLVNLTNDELFEHFINFGLFEHRKYKFNNDHYDFAVELSDLMNKLNLVGFDPKYYASKYQDVKSSKLSPLENYLKVGKKLGRYKNIVEELKANFDDRYYLQQNNEALLHLEWVKN